MVHVARVWPWDHTHWVLSDQRASSHPCLLCCNSHLIPIVSNHLPSFSSPANYALTAFQTSKLRFAHNRSDNSRSIGAKTEGILMRCIIAQHNAFIHQPSCNSARQFTSRPSSPDNASRFPFSSLRHWARALCFSRAPIHHEPPFITVILLICNFQNGDQLGLKWKHCFLRNISWQEREALRGWCSSHIPKEDECNWNQIALSWFHHAFADRRAGRPTPNIFYQVHMHASSTTGGLDHDCTSATKY